MSSPPTSMVGDKYIAHRLQMTTSWPRKQRWLRRNNQPHILTIDAVMVGKSVRYRLSDFETWLENLSQPI